MPETERRTGCRDGYRCRDIPRQSDALGSCALSPKFSSQPARASSLPIYPILFRHVSLSRNLLSQLWPIRTGPNGSPVVRVRRRMPSRTTGRLRLKEWVPLSGKISLGQSPASCSFPPFSADETPPRVRTRSFSTSRMRAAPVNEVREAREGPRRETRSPITMLDLCQASRVIRLFPALPGAGEFPTRERSRMDHARLRVATGNYRRGVG